MQALLNEYAAIIASDEAPSDRFWKLEAKLKKDVRNVGVCVEMNRSALFNNLLCLLDKETITMEDLNGFSVDLKRNLAALIEMR